MDRFENSASLVKMDLPYSVDELIDAVKSTIKENDLEECYIRPIAYYGYGKMGLNPEGAPVNVAIAVWPWGSYLGEEGLEKGIQATITDWKRIHSDILPRIRKRSRTMPIQFSQSSMRWIEGMTKRS